MTRTSLLAISCVLLGVLACGGPPASPGANKQAANKQGASKSGAAKAEAPKPAQPPAPEPAQPATVEPPPAEPAAPEAPTEPAEGDEPTADEGAAAAKTPEPAEGGEPAADAAAGWKPPADADIRSDAVVPPGTPSANAKAFKRLPKSKADGPPVSAIAGNGLHFDVMVVGRGWEKSRCVEETSSFSAASDDRVNICLRVIHPKDAEESLTVEWSKNGGKATRRSTITVKAMHAYLTRGYLPIKPGYEGDWVATIKHPDGTVLATLPFSIQ